MSTTEETLDRRLDGVPKSSSFPSHLPPLTPTAEVAVLARVLYREGYNDHSNGHITYKVPDGTLLATPFEFPWDEVRASDIMHMAVDGTVLGGKWQVNPAIELHIQLHAAHPDLQIAVHNHPEYGTIWAAHGRVPAAYDQLSSMLDDDEIVIYDDFAGTVEKVEAAQANVRGVGEYPIALLRHHGVLVLADDIRQAYFRCSALEWRSRLAWRVEAVGPAAAMSEPNRQSMAKLTHVIGGFLPNIWEAAARREIRLDPSVLL